MDLSSRERAHAGGSPPGAVVAREIVPTMPTTRRWQPADFDGWIMERLVHRWSITDEKHWRAKLTGMASSNTHWFVTNEFAVILAVVERHPMTAAPVTREIFAWARAADCKDDVYNIALKSHGDLALRALYKQMREWSHDMGATRFFPGVCSDILPSDLRTMFSGAYYLVGAPC